MSKFIINDDNIKDIRNKHEIFNISDDPVGYIVVKVSKVIEITSSSDIAFDIVESGMIQNDGSYQQISFDQMSTDKDYYFMHESELFGIAGKEITINRNVDIGQDKNIDSYVVFTPQPDSCSFNLSSSISYYFNKIDNNITTYSNNCQQEKRNRNGCRPCRTSRLTWSRGNWSGTSDPTARASPPR